MRILALLLFLAPLPACGEIRLPAAGVLELELPAEYHEPALLALQDWNDATRATRAPTSLRPHDDMDLDPADALVTVERFSKPLQLGATHRSWDSTPHIRIAPDLPPDVVRRTIAHEIGHALGLEHAGAGLMCARDLPGATLDRQTVNQWLDLEGAPLDQNLPEGDVCHD